MRLRVRYLFFLVSISVIVSFFLSYLRFSHREATLCIWPEECEKPNDRISEQLKLQKTSNKIFKILPPAYNFPLGAESFRRDKCFIDKCEITYDHHEADALVLPNADVSNEIAASRRPSQVWIAYLLESPVNTFNPRFRRKNRGKYPFNWTASYRSDSDIVTPYSKFVVNPDYHGNQLDIETEWQSASQMHKELIGNKNRQVAWFVSNCHAANNRLEYAKELAKYINVDIYGKCGNLTCNKWERSDCLNRVNKHYKFYLSFENSNCKEYITEKLYENAYGYNDPNHLMVPIVMGPPESDYSRLVPPNSFIHVNDFSSPKDLAKYLNYLDENNSAYYSYFRWKKIGNFIDTKFMCRVCAMLHHSALIERPPKSIEDIENWWNHHEDDWGNTISSCSYADAIE